MKTKKCLNCGFIDLLETTTQEGITFEIPQTCKKCDSGVYDVIEALKPPQEESLHATCPYGNPDCPKCGKRFIPDIDSVCIPKEED